MNKSEIKNNYKKKIKLLDRYNKYYYDKSNPIVTDTEYDELKKKIFELENKYDFLKSKKSPSKVIGFKPSKNFNKLSHKVPMLSLSNAFERILINIM